MRLGLCHSFSFSLCTHRDTRCENNQSPRNARMHITASSSFFFIISVTLPLLLHSAAAHNRRFLHQPFFPLDSQPPNSPSSALSPPTVPAPPFFPSSSSLSPPSPPIPVSLPVNVSSFTFPRDSKSKRASSNLAVVAIAAVVSAVIVLSIAVWLHFRKKRIRDSTASKTQRSDNSSRINYAGTGPGSGQMDVPKLERPSQTSSEFLYLGTLVDSYGGIGTTAGTNNHRQNPAAVSAAPNSRKSDSPDLRPLPPLRQQSTTCGKNGNAEFGSRGLDEEEEEEEEVFYSPKGSLGGKESSIGTGSFSRRASSAVTLQKFGSSSSFSSSSSDSASPVRSVSLSISPPVSFSPKEFRRNSPELVAAQAPPPFRPPPPPPPPPVPFFCVPLVKRKESQSPSLSPSPSPSPPSSSSPERVYSRSRETSPGISYCSNDENLDTPQPIKSPPTRHVPRVPPPPPPPPPPLTFKNLGSPRTTTPQARGLVSEPPVLVAPLKPMSVESPSLISPIQLPSNLKVDEKDDKTVDCKVDSDDNEEVPKPKLKPLHWDKVRASSGREMVWDQLIKSSSFKLNEEMIETLFVAKPPPIQAPKETTRWQVLPLPTQGNRVLDPKKSQNIAILLRALNVTVDEVCDSLLEGSADYLGTELLESLLKMAPTKEEERKLKEYKDDSPGKLGPAEKFLKAVLDIPFAFKRVEALLYISNFESETEYLKNSFQTLETACEELRNSRMFLKLLEAVLKTGNRMNVGTNRGDAHAFKLDTLLKLVDIKGADGKTTLLHFVVQEIIRSEGIRLHSADKATGSSVNDDVKSRKLGLQVVSSIVSELNNVKKAAAMDSEVLHGDVLKLSNGLENIAVILGLVGTTGKEEEKNKFTESVAKFMITAEEEIIKLRAEESVALTLVKEITEYFHGNSAKEEAHPFRIFMVVRDFLTCLDRVCKEVGSINERTTVSAAHKFPIPVNPTFQQVRRLNSFSDDESS